MLLLGFFSHLGYYASGWPSCRMVPGRPLDRITAWQFLATNTKQPKKVVQKKLELFKELRQDNYLNANPAIEEDRTLDLRSIVEEMIDLPAGVLDADFSHVYERILDRKTISELIEPSTLVNETVDWSNRYRRRKEALMPYIDQRLICVCIRLPGIVYTIEIDPGAAEVVHWEWQSV